MRPFPWLLQVFFVVFAAIAYAALVNVTVDDAALYGPVVPQYLPAPTNWNADCTSCPVKPDPAQVYDGTWHDTTYSSSNNFTQVVEFTFTGSAVYIFFIIANQVSGATTLTDVQFILDQAIVGRYTHAPTTSTDYQYNVAVYSNDSLTLGPHNMMIQPVNSGPGNNVLILFDYLIYTTNASSSASSFPISTTSVVALSSLSLVTPSTTTFPPSVTGRSSSPNISAIVGVSVGGVALVGAALFYLRRYKKRRDNGQPEERAVVDPFTFSHDGATARTAMTSTHLMGSSVTEPTSKFRTGVSSVATFSTDPSSSGATSSRGDPLREEVELLRGEVARLRQLQDPGLGLSREPPPYS